MRRPLSGATVLLLAAATFAGDCGGDDDGPVATTTPVGFDATIPDVFEVELEDARIHLLELRIS